MNREERRKLEQQTNSKMKLVGKRLPGINLGELKGKSIGEQVDGILKQAAEAGEPMPEEAGHIPAIGALSMPENAWGVHCLRCSGDANDYVYPCKYGAEDWPPQVLVPYVPPTA